MVVGGPWGSSSDGTEWTYKPNGPITRMEFSSGHHKTIYSINFIGQENYIAGRDQFYYPDGFDIKPSEYLIGIKGGYKHFSDPEDGDYTAIQWLSFETNVGEVRGPFGCTEPGSTEFSYKAPDGNSIVGFQGRAEEHLNAIGVLVDPLPRSKSCEVIDEVGPWGTPSGEQWTYNPDSPITEIVVVHADDGFIISVLFKTEKDVEGKFFGHQNCSYSLKTETIKLNSPSVYLTGMSGTFTDLINSLSFQTSDGTQHGPIGAADKGTPFSTSNVKDGYTAITGFHGHGPTSHISSIGVHVKRICNHSNLNPYIFVKQWGGPGGKKWEFHPDNGVINQIIICDGEVIFSLRLKGEDGSLSDKFGGNGGTEKFVEIPQGVHLEGISGTFGTLKHFTVLTSLKFYTSDGKEHGPFGKPVGTEFSLSIDGSIVGFHGHAGGLVDAIGVYLKPKPLN